MKGVIKNTEERKKKGGSVNRVANALADDCALLLVKRLEIYCTYKKENRQRTCIGDLARRENMNSSGDLDEGMNEHKEL